MVVSRRRKVQRSPVRHATPHRRPYPPSESRRQPPQPNPHPRRPESPTRPRTSGPTPHRRLPYPAPQTSASTPIQRAFTGQAMARPVPVRPEARLRVAIRQELRSNPIRAVDREMDSAVPHKVRHRARARPVSCRAVRVRRTRRSVQTIVPPGTCRLQAPIVLRRLRAGHPRLRGAVRPATMSGRRRTCRLPGVKGPLAVAWRPGAVTHRRITWIVVPCHAVRVAVSRRPEAASRGTGTRRRDTLRRIAIRWRAVTGAPGRRCHRQVVTPRQNMWPVER